MTRNGLSFLPYFRAQSFYDKKFSVKNTYCEKPAAGGALTKFKHLLFF